MGSLQYPLTPSDEIIVDMHFQVAYMLIPTCFYDDDAAADVRQPTASSHLPLPRIAKFEFVSSSSAQALPRIALIMPLYETCRLVIEESTLVICYSSTLHVSEATGLLGSLQVCLFHSSDVRFPQRFQEGIVSLKHGVLGSLPYCILLYRRHI